MGYLKLVFIMLVFSSAALAQKDVAVVKLIRGQAVSTIQGKSVTLKANDWVKDGASVATLDKSFVKLVFIDKSQMNIGPNSVMKIEKFSEKEAGVIDLVKGKIRSQVTKDYLQIQNRDTSKLFIKTPNAVMGVRGTDFLISTNGKNTATVLFEGRIVFNNLETRETNTNRLERIVEAGVHIRPGEFSVVDDQYRTPTIPAIMNVQQIEKLELNREFEPSRAPSSTDTSAKSVTPPGLTGTVVSNTSDTLKSELKEVGVAATPERAPSSADGFIDGNKVKPANGSFVHIDSGTIIPPSADSVLDKNSNSYIASTNGTVAADGDYRPPKNVQITGDGKILVSVVDENGKTKVQEVQKPNVVISGKTPSLGQAAEVLAKNPGVLNPGGVVSNDIINSNFVPSGLTDLSNNNRNGNATGLAETPGAVARPATRAPARTEIIIKPQ